MRAALTASASTRAAFACMLRGVRLSLASRIGVGFLVLLSIFAGASALAVWQLHTLRDDLALIHEGYLALGRGAAQLRTLEEARDAAVSRAMSPLAPGSSPQARRPFLSYARDFYPRALRDRLDEMDQLTQDLQRRRLRAEDRAFLRDLADQLASVRALEFQADDATARLLERFGAAADDAESSNRATDEVVDEQRGRVEELARASRAIAKAVDGKVADAVVRAERDERNSTWMVIALALGSAFTGVVVLVSMIRSLRPLQSVLEGARAISRGALDDVFVPLPAGSGGSDDEVQALGREFNQMARALKDREAVLAQRQQELLRLSIFAENVIRSVRTGIVVLDDGAAVRTLNPAARSVFQLPLVDVDGRPLPELLDAAVKVALSPVLTALSDVRSQGEPRSFPMLKVGHRVVDVALIPLRDRAGAILTDTLLLGEDVTAREETRERLLQSERLAAIGRLAAQITHEIRNPLSSVGLNIELLGDDVAHLPEARRAEAASILAAVLREVDRLTQITEGYLRFARLPAPKRVAGDVGDLLADLVAFSQGDAGKGGVMLELQIEPGLPSVPHDPPRLRQAMLNLLRNALEAAGRGGTVRVGAKATPGGARLSVEDTGPGIPDDVKERLFQPFFTTKPSGTGLGLLMAKEIILEHRGELVVGRSPLGGALFAVDLPSGDPHLDGEGDRS